MSRPVTVEPNQKVIVEATGLYLLIREASSAFSLKAGSQRFTLEGGDEIKVEGGFKRLTFTNLSSSEDLTVDFIAGSEPFGIDYVKLPRTRIVGYDDISLGADATRDFPGIDEFGKRRKQFTLTVGPDIQGAIILYDTDTDTMLAIISTNETAGIGFAIETDANLTIKNCTDEATLTSLAAGQTAAAIVAGSGANIAISETFYR